MLDIKFIRENPDKVKENLKKKFQENKISMVDDLLENDSKYLSLLKEVEELRSKRNKVSSEINKIKKEGGDVAAFLKEAKQIPQKIKEVEDQLEPTKTKITELLMSIPNMIHESVPIGENDTKNVVREVIGKPEEKGFEVKSHVEIVEELGIADFDTSAET